MFSRTVKGNLFTMIIVGFPLGAETFAQPAKNCQRRIDTQNSKCVPSKTYLDIRK